MTLKTQDEKMKVKGFKYRTDVWIHPKTGSDYLENIYTEIEITAENIKEVVGKRKKYDGFTCVKL